YGFGERTGPLNKCGIRMEMRDLDCLGYNAERTDPLYKHFPFYITFNPELNIAYGLLYDNMATTVFDMGREIDAIWDPYRKYEAIGGDIDYYMIYGPTISEVVEKLSWLTGRPFLPPRYSLGYLGSTMSYTEAPDAQEQLKSFSRLVREHDIPCDLFHLSSGYTTDGDGNRNVFTWNHDRVPDPQSMVQSFHDASIHLAANVKPYLLEANPHHATLVESGGFVRDADDPTTHKKNFFWSGGAHERGPGAYIDFTSAAGYAWWQQQLQQQLFDYGIDVAWDDNNEFEVWDDAVISDGFGDPIPMGLARPLHTLLMNHASYMATLQNRPDERPFVLSRSGCPGIQRYAQTWSGDNDTSWHSLKYNIPMGLGISLSGAPNTGHDVGGFYGPKPSAELFVRWVQNGIFHPRFTIHSWNTDQTVNEPWMYPEVLPQVREAIAFRYRLMPYLYSLFVESYRTGAPIIRPMVYHYPHDPRTHEESFDFLLGEHLLVASVLDEGATTRDVYLPEGTGWYDFHDENAFYEGGQTITLDAPLERFPLLVPEGGIIPMGKLMRYVGELADDERTIYIFPHRGSGESRFTLFEDDGISNDYRDGKVATVAITVTALPDNITLTADIDDANYPLPYSTMTVVLPAGEKRPVTADGNAALSQLPDEDGRRAFELRLKG
ncbi:MAG: glycoside hydrolase family 31 protein, partial [Chloroflexota bacterium]